jgi:hypothetical protein
MFVLFGRFGLFNPLTISWLSFPPKAVKNNQLIRVSVKTKEAEYMKGT